METVGVARRVRIYIGEQDKGKGGPLWEAILELLRKEGAAGATMFRGVAGFGVHSQLHIARFADLAPNLPVLVEWIDTPDRIARLLPRVRGLVEAGMITIEDVDVVQYQYRELSLLPPDRVGDVMTTEVSAVRSDTSIADVVQRLLDRDYRAMPVVNGEGRLIGIITDRDLVERGGLSTRLDLLAALGRDALDAELSRSEVRQKTAGEVASKSPTTVTADDALEHALHLMVERGMKRLPVIDEEKHLIGMLSRVDVLRTMGQAYAPVTFGETPKVPGARLVGQLMRRDAPTVDPDAPLAEVLDLVAANPLHRAVVVDPDRRVLGMIGDADLLARLDPAAKKGALGALMGRGKPPQATGVKARDIMRKPAVTAPVETPIAEATRTMVEARIRVLPIVDESGRLVGIIDRQALLSQWLEFKPGSQA